VRLKYKCEYLHQRSASSEPPEAVGRQVLEASHYRTFHDYFQLLLDHSYEDRFVQGLFAASQDIADRRVLLGSTYPSPRPQGLTFTIL